MNLEQLISRGFDNSSKEGGKLLVKCSRCAAMTVNGTPIHEHGCPNETRECAGCDAIIPKRQKYCADCQL